MIKNISEISNLGIYKDFIWNNCVFEFDKNGVKQSYDFGAINIIYGRNYSGKTTLSRLISSFSTGLLPKKYENPSYCVEFQDNKIINQSQLKQHSFDIRVFNQDYIDTNLGFLSDENDKIKSFLILGERNNEIEEQINVLTDEIGIEGSNDIIATGLRAELKEAKDYEDRQYFHCQKLIKEKDKLLSDKATIGKDSFKLQNQYFGNNTINYNKSRLELDLLSVSKDSLLETEKVHELKVFIDEEVKPLIQLIQPLNIELTDLQSKVIKSISFPLSMSNSIKDLLNDPFLENWIRNGKILHEKNVHKHKCLFCHNEIREDLWDKLDQHFNKQSEKLISSLNGLKLELQNNLSFIKKITPFHFENSKLYIEFRDRVKPIQDEINLLLKEASKFIESLIELVDTRIFSVNTVLDYKPAQDDYVLRINEQIGILNSIIEESNTKTKNIDFQKNQARNKLFSHELAKFNKAIDILDINEEIESNLNELQEFKKDKQEIETEITTKLFEISSLKQELLDESLGAEKINQILSTYLVSSKLRLEPCKENGICHYQVIREGKIAFNLSEGEKSLIAFCYFIATLSDINSINDNKIIWIDDPISSLDSDNIYYIYSLIRDIVQTNQPPHKQLFISTHNLEFLKLSKRINGKDKPKRFYLIDRSSVGSRIQRMPNYLAVYTSEFNYLFENIYRCSIEAQNDSNYYLFYNFANNCRKFLEIYLAFKYPTGSDTEKERLSKMSQVFGDQINTFFVERVTNEYSHLSGSLERGNLVIDKSEIQTVANLVIGKIKDLDEDQYNAFLTSINNNRDSKI